MKNNNHQFAKPQGQLPPITVSIRELSANRHRFTVYPPFQRQAVWQLVGKQGLIDSILLGDPIPALEGYQEFSDKGETIYPLIDGHQRVTAILDYVDGKFKTWTAGRKRLVEPNSAPPVEPGKFFEGLDVFARNYFLDYRLTISLIRKESEEQLITRFIRIQNHIPLSSAEKLIAYASKAKKAAKTIEQHPFWSDCYEGEKNRKQIYQSSLRILALELSPDGIINLQSGAFVHDLASGKQDHLITDAVTNAVLARLDTISHVYMGTHYTIGGAIIAMYQSIIFLERAGYSVQNKDKGKLTEWISPLLDESKHAVDLASYHRPIQKLRFESIQRAFWEKHWEEVMALFGLDHAA